MEQIDRRFRRLLEGGAGAVDVLARLLEQSRRGVGLRGPDPVKRIEPLPSSSAWRSAKATKRAPSS